MGKTQHLGEGRVKQQVLGIMEKGTPSLQEDKLGKLNPQEDEEKDTQPPEKQRKITSAFRRRK